MKISILLPYKENFSSQYAGAVSLFINETVSISSFKKDIRVFGNTEYKNNYNNYYNLKISNKKFSSRNYHYVKNFTKQNYVKESDLIEIHNRPVYLKYIKEDDISSKFIIYFHNDPLSIKGSESIKERIYILEQCSYVIFISSWLKKQFFKDIDTNKYDYKILIISHSAKKNQINFKTKKNIVLFVGKLNSSKGYDIFGNALIDILKKHKNWKAVVIGDEPREKINFVHDRFITKGFLKHSQVINYYKKSKISVTCSRWEEPLGRGGIEASANGCLPIVSNRGGLVETITDGIILNKLSRKELFNIVNKLILNDKLLNELQLKCYKNFHLTHEAISKKIDNYRNKLNLNININLSKNRNLKILHVTNFNQRHFGRLHYNTGKRINNGLVRLGHNVLSISDRDITYFSKSLIDPSGSKSLDRHLISNFNYFKPEILILGHADKVNEETLFTLKKNNKNLKIIQWFLDPLTKFGPDYKKNKERILKNINYIDNTFLTTDPKEIGFKINNSFFIPNPCDESFEVLKNYEKDCFYDVFFAMSHGVHRGILKQGKVDEREKFILKIKNKTPNLRYNLFGIGNTQPIWGDNFLNQISNSKMGINISRGKPIKYYSSDRIAQLMGNGLLTFIHKNTYFHDFFSNNEMIFYKNENDLIENLLKYSRNDKERRRIAKNGRLKYHKYFNSKIISNFMINKVLDINKKYKFMWEN